MKEMVSREQRKQKERDEAKAAKAAEEAAKADGGSSKDDAPAEKAEASA